MKKVVYCKISSWKGYVPGAEHYYADLRQREGGESWKTIEKKVYHNLTLSEAERLNRRNPDERWEAGEEVGYFFDRDRAVEGAVAAYKGLFPGAVLLVEGEIGTYQPQLILDGPPKVMEAINDLYRQAEDNDGWEGDEEAMRLICEAWEAIWIPEFEEE
jgi:hypothetical protein